MGTLARNILDLRYGAGVDQEGPRRRAPTGLSPLLPGRFDGQCEDLWEDLAS